ncbi:hypothetical protein Sulba_1051 [Sulfurospirillum barnesii SES-3]|uniref:Uncharacterized protein n=1 Tax=Sulfurospirillum barnesii (strain ATCC 700032 / DSM 10660 / SES-3) TaxID=760154 RepID=I3XWM5_SULBS|nr:hypothetical protein Sulba_1051 [Sulfurospirillum barnesii SES-3]
MYYDRFSYWNEGTLAGSEVKQVLRAHLSHKDAMILILPLLMVCE